MRVSKTLTVAAMFERIAPRYDLLNRLMSLGLDRSWRRLAVQAAKPAPGLRALDVGAGTGDLTLALAADGRPQWVTGVDLSAAMLRQGRRKAKAAKLDRCIDLLQADVVRLPFADCAFDCITTAFMVRNLSDLPAALRELSRVLSPGGRLAILEITRPGDDLKGRLFSFYFGRVVPLLGGMIAGDRAAYAYLPASVERFLSADELSQALVAAGFEDVAFCRLGPGPVALHAAVRGVNPSQAEVR